MNGQERNSELWAEFQAEYASKGVMTDCQYIVDHPRWWHWLPYVEPLINQLQKAADAIAHQFAHIEELKSKHINALAAIAPEMEELKERANMLQQSAAEDEARIRTQLGRELAVQEKRVKDLEVSINRMIDNACIMASYEGVSIAMIINAMKEDGKAFTAPTRCIGSVFYHAGKHGAITVLDMDGEDFLPYNGTWDERREEILAAAPTEAVFYYCQSGQPRMAMPRQQLDALWKAEQEAAHADPD